MRQSICASYSNINVLKFSCICTYSTWIPVRLLAMIVYYTCLIQSSSNFPLSSSKNPIVSFVFSSTKSATYIIVIKIIVIKEHDHIILPLLFRHLCILSNGEVFNIWKGLVQLKKKKTWKTMVSNSTLKKKKNFDHSIVLKIYHRWGLPYLLISTLSLSPTWLSLKWSTTYSL